MQEQTTATQDEYFDAQAIMDAPAVIEEDMVIPEWGGKKVRIRSITKEEQQTIHQMSKVGDDDYDRRIIERQLFLVAVVRPAMTLAQVTAVFKKQAGVIDRILGRINVISGLTESAEVSKSAIADATKSPSE